MQEKWGRKFSAGEGTEDVDTELETVSKASVPQRNAGRITNGRKFSAGEGTEDVDTELE